MSKPDVQARPDARPLALWGARVKAVLEPLIAAAMPTETILQADAAMYAKWACAFLHQPRRSNMLKGALRVVQSWNETARDLGQAPADALEKELENFIASQDRWAASLEPPKTAKRRGPRSASAEHKELLRKATIALQEKLRLPRALAARKAREYFKAHKYKLLPERRAPNNPDAAYRREPRDKFRKP